MAIETMRSPVAGTVFRVECAIGAPVSAGDVLLIVEAMKMEIPVDATFSGRIVSLAVASGDIVEEGQAVCEIET